MKRFFKSSYFAIVLAFIYLPIVIMIIFSFNSGSTTFAFNGWSLQWYSEFFNNSPFVKSIITSLFVAVVSTAISLIIGVMAAIGLSKLKPTTQKAWVNVANVPLINADVVTAVSLMIIFLLAGFSFGIGTLIMAHISFNVPYVLITVMPRLRKIDKSILESAHDLGAKESQVIFRVILPILKPAIIAAAAIAFAMSFDDFIISYFTGGAQTNVSVFIYTAKRVKPFIFAFGTMLVLIIAIAIITWNAFSIIKQKREETKESIKNGLYKQKQIHKLDTEIDRLVDIIESGQKITKSKKLSLWIQYWYVKMKLSWLSSRNYDKKITKLEWKQYRIKSEISKEKRYFSRFDHTKKTIKKIKLQLSKPNIDIKKAARLTIQLERLEDKLEFLNEEIEYIKNRDEINLNKAKEIQKEINELKKDFKKEIEPSKKLVSWYNKKIKDLEQYKIDVEEGKNYYKLRLVVERLKELKQLKYDKVLLLNEQLEHLYNLTHPKKSLTSKTDELILLTTNIVELKELNLYKNEQLNLINNHLLMKIDNKLHEVSKLNQKIDNAKNKLLAPNDDDDVVHIKGFFARSWKVILVVIISVAAFTGLTVAYVINNIYDLVIGNWGEYIDPDIISEFESEYDVKVNYQTYDSNETLYNKLFTFNYDVMVPSDYMVQKLAKENKLLKLDYSKLNINGNINGNNLNMSNPNPNDFNYDLVEFDSTLLSVMATSNVDTPEDDLELYPEQTSTNNNILSYAVPYFWGDLVIVVNPTQSNLNFLAQSNVDVDAQTGQIDYSTLSWDLLWDAKNANKNIALNNDPKNVFMLGAQKNFNQVNLNTKAEVDTVISDVKDLVQAKNVSLNGDDLITKVGSGNFDFAVMYNGDAVYANQIYNESYPDTKFLFGRPFKNGQSTNIFSDNMVISKRSKNQDLAYKWVNFMIEKMEENTEYVAIASPSINAIDNVTSIDGEFEEFADLYIPANQTIVPGNNLSYQYNPLVDDYLVNEFNNIIAGKN